MTAAARIREICDEIEMLGELTMFDTATGAQHLASRLFKISEQPGLHEGFRSEVRSFALSAQRHAVALESILLNPSRQDMKRITKTEHVTKAWAEQSRTQAYAASASFQALDLFSWRTRIGRLFPKQRVALICPRGYSQSTSVVQNQAIMAARHAGYRVFSVPGARSDHLANVAEYDRRIEVELGMIEKAIRPDNYRQAALRLLEEQAAYIRAFKVKAGRRRWSAKKIAATLSRAERAKAAA